MNKLSVFLTALLAVVLMSGTSLAAGTATMTKPTGNSQPTLRETDEYPALGYSTEHFGIAPVESNPYVVKSEPLRPTDEYPALGYSNEYYGVAPAWTNWTNPSMVKPEPPFRDTDEHPPLGYGNH